MRGLKRKFAALLRDNRGATAVEYGLIIALIVIALMTGLSQMSGGTREMWGNLNNKVTKASNIN